MVIPKIVCPWCLTETHSKGAYKHPVRYHCPHCAQPFWLRDGAGIRHHPDLLRNLAVIAVLAFGLFLVAAFTR